MENGQLLPTDWELVRRARSSDQAAFHQLVDRYAGVLYGLAVHLVGNAADAEDVVQETFAGAFRGLSGFRERSSLKTWLTQILVRQAARHFRTKGRRKVIPFDPRQAEPSGGESAGPRADVRMDLAAAIGALGLEHREVIVLRELQGMSYEQISAVLGVPQGTVESRLFRARRELQELLKDYKP